MSGYAPDGGPNGAVSPAAMLSDLIGRVTRAEDRLTDVSSDLSEIAAGQADLGRLIEGLGRHLSAVQVTLDQLTGDDAEADDDGTTVVDWSRLTRAEAEREWSRLYDWLSGWLVPTYGITIRQLLPCWPHHAAVREELSWLRTCWMQVYRRPGASGSAAAEWHTRWLQGALDNVKRHFGRGECTLGKHAGHTLPDELRTLDAGELSLQRYWLDDGRQADLAARG
ncbi:hypothetical protein BAY59_38425 (plasmid) [Prauserella coralliicola]|nr:hypothetical protein BAY59_38425 [Prauserella coralliicola]